MLPTTLDFTITDMIKHTPITKDVGSIVEGTFAELMALDDIELRDLIYRRKALVFKNIDVSADEMAAFSKKFGRPWTADMYQNHTKEHFKVASNNVAYTEYDDKSYPRLYKSLTWHCDIANERGLEPFPFRLLYCKDLPTKMTGGSTDVADLGIIRREWDSKDKHNINLNNLKFLYNSWQKNFTNQVWYPALDRHPWTGEEFVRYNAFGNDGAWILRTVINKEEGELRLSNEFMRELSTSQIEATDFLEHKWEIGDVLVFDNWATIHRRGDMEILEGSEGRRSFIRISIDHEFDKMPPYTA